MLLARFLFCFLTLMMGFNLDIDDTDFFVNRSDILAVPNIFGYSVEEGLEKFPSFYYPPCSERYAAQPLERMVLDFNRNLVEFSCPANSTPYFVVPMDQEIQLPDPRDIRFHTKKFKYKEPTGIEDWVEYALGSCEKTSKRMGVTERVLKPRYKEKDYLNRIQNQSSKKKMIILLISADSFSRRHLFRKLKETVKLLKSLHQYEVIDFKLHNIIGTDTAGNQIHLFGPLGSNSARSENDLLGEEAIWSIMKKHKFMTMWATDGCSSNVPKALGPNPDVDHVVATFFCANKLYSMYTADKYHTYEQRCMGNKMSHSYIMNYTQEFSLLYLKADQWIYNHFTAGHETSGQHAQSLDKDLKDYLEWFMRTFDESHNLVILLNGDHGMRYGEHMSKTKSIQEYRLPASFIIAKRSFLAQVANLTTLQSNSWKLNSKPDLRESMIYLAKRQSGLELENKPSGLTTFLLNQACRTGQDTQPRAMNLFQDSIPSDRTCQAAGIPAWFCSYIILSPSPLHSLKFPLTSKAIFQIFSSIVELLTTEILSKSLKHEKVPRNCSILELETSKVPFITQSEWVIRLAFNCESAKIKIYNSWIYLSQKRSYEESVNQNSYFPSFPILLGFSKYFCKVVHFSGNDLV